MRCAVWQRSTKVVVKAVAVAGHVSDTAVGRRLHQRLSPRTGEVATRVHQEQVPTRPHDPRGLGEERPEVAHMCERQAAHHMVDLAVR